MRCLRDSGVILEDYAPRNFILNGEGLFVVDFEAWEESPAVQHRWPDDKNLKELHQIRAETIIEKRISSQLELVRLPLFLREVVDLPPLSKSEAPELLKSLADGLPGKRALVAELIKS
ncbi:hypothetical protein MRS44_009492 [Fusarium solani]|uniref:uncharacterized protein n=1 Tax=Fusarium solani TaxID=169388 RepID=UPI0032C3F64F|nr:hypothetical protein MRS44_009492 [Fusarium solani]